MNEAITGYELHLVFVWARHGLLQVPVSCGGLDATSDEKLFLYFHCLYKYKFLERYGGSRHPWRCCVIVTVPRRDVSSAEL